MEQETQNPDFQPQEDLYAQEERCSRALKNVARACVMRVVVTGLLLLILVWEPRELWMWGLLLFVMLLNLGGMLPLVAELKRLLREQKRLRSLEP